MKNLRTWKLARIAVCALLNLAAVCATQAQERKKLTVERIYGQPSLSGQLTTGVQWVPDGKSISYYQRSGSGRDAKTDIVVLNPANGEKVVLDSDKWQALLPRATEGGGIGNQATGLGRRAAQRYIWAPVGGLLLFVAEGNLYLYDLEQGKGRALTSGKDAVKDPKFSPNAEWVSFLRNHELWVVNVAYGKEWQITKGGSEDILNGELDWVYPEELSIGTAYWWSPDSTQVAFLQMDQSKVTKYPLVNHLSYTGAMETMRYPKAGDANPVVRVGVVAVAGGTPRWMDTGKETDQYIPRVAWLMDSKRLAIQRLNRAQNKLELLFNDAGSGEGRVMLTEEDPKAWVNIDDDWRFLKDGKRFLWGGERDGFRHLYLYDTNGKLVRQLTKGNWVVTGVDAVDEKNGLVYFTATEKSTIERHLYKVSLDGGSVTRITKEEGTHRISMSSDAAYFLDTYSNASTPPRQDIYRADGTKLQTLNENKVAELAEYGLSKTDYFQVKGADGTMLDAFMIKPPDFSPAKKYPVLINTYGGPHGQIVNNSWGATNALWHQMMAQKGYVIFGLDNRGMAARGHAFESHIYKRMGECELADQLAGVAWLKSQAWVDGARIGIWGWSYGGYMTTYSMLNAPDTFKAGFAGAPVTDWRQYDTIYTERYMSRPQDNAEGYKKSAPANAAAKLKGKLLIAHGTGDDNVHFSNTLELQEELIKAGKYAEIAFYPGRGHGITDTRARIQLFNRVTQFFLDNL